MKINTGEISALIKQQIKDYKHKFDSNDVGTVISVGDGIAIVYGLDQAMLGELLLFPNDIYGLVMNLEKENHKYLYKFTRLYQVILRRKSVFHQARDVEKILDELENGKKK